MQIYRFPRSRSLKVLWVLEELGIDYDSLKVDLLTAQPSIQSPHPFGKVPYLVDGDLAISETLAICIYLCEKNAGDSLYPQDPVKQSAINTWISFALTDLESSVWGLLKQRLFVPAEQRSEAVIHYFTAEVQRVLQQIQLDETQPWIASDNFSLADIFMSQTLQWVTACGITLVPLLDAYLQKTMSRASFIRAVALNDAP